MSCDICVEDFNKSNHKEISCPFCDFSVCLVCMKRYLMESIKNVPDCMACHKDFSMDFIYSVMPKKFHSGEYRDKLIDSLLSQEKSLLPDTQNLVQAYINRGKKSKEIQELEDEKAYLKFRLKEIQDRIRVLNEEQRRDDPLARINGGTLQEEKKERKKFIMRCPDEECRGFLSQAWKCGTCEKYACSQCMVIKTERNDENHICDPDMVATVKMIKSETKPCPKCAVPIYKIDGCSQMWCTD